MNNAALYFGVFLITFVANILAPCSFAQINPPLSNADDSDEQISISITQPFPIIAPPSGCQANYNKHFCREDKKPIRSYSIVEKKFSEPSAIDNIRIEEGCLLIDIKVAVPIKKSTANECQDSEAVFSVTLLLSVKEGEITKGKMGKADDF